ncbi:MAG: hypothetical protein HZC38_01245 [Chloroflexi bacterium]|nr:hypothetical protein [Chloroflexota bacterium]
MSNEGQSGGVNISGGTVNVSGDIVGHDKIVNASPQATAIADWRKDMEKKVDAQPNLSADDKQVIKDNLAKIEKESVKGDQADVNQIEKWFNMVAVMGPEIFEVAVATAINPLGGVGLVLKKISDKAKLEKQPKK